MCELLLDANIEFDPWPFAPDTQGYQSDKEQPSRNSPDIAKREEACVLQKATCVASVFVTYILLLSRHLKP